MTTPGEANLKQLLDTLVKGQEDIRGSVKQLRTQVEGMVGQLVKMETLVARLGPAQERDAWQEWYGSWRDTDDSRPSSSAIRPRNDNSENWRA